MKLSKITKITKNSLYGKTAQSPGKNPPLQWTWLREPGALVEGADAHDRLVRVPVRRMPR